VLVATERMPGVCAEYLLHNAVLPVEWTVDRLVVATWDPARAAHAVDELAILTGLDTEIVAMDEAVARDAIRRWYTRSGDVAAELHTIHHSERDRDVSTHDLLAIANEPPVIRYVSLLLAEALDTRASDVHIELAPEGADVRFRVDGVLVPAPAPPPDFGAAVVSRIKVMADLDIAERRRPQDGRVRVNLAGREVDLRVSSVPLLAGESLVVRLLSASSERLDLAALGLAPDALGALEAVCARTHGLVLVVGPTGSGKTTTLYAMIEALRTGSEKIITLEDPVEYRIPGLSQIAVNLRAGMGFAEALRSVLRQDPDIILVGEIRDSETAVLATQAALTGHLVLSTLHTVDSPGALIRLFDLGVPAYLVASTVEAVVAQRLVRKTCAVCAGVLPAREACEPCRRSGFRGRTGVFELLEPDDALRSAMLRSPRHADLLRAARLAGGRSLRDDAMRVLEAGLTSSREIARALGTT
jgi:general secretion pathway protein E